MKRSIIALAMFVTAFAVQRAGAIAVADLATAEEPPTDEGYTFDWSHVHKYKNASSAAVDHYWILTAGHVGDDGGTGNVNVEGET